MSGEGEIKAAIKSRLAEHENLLEMVAAYKSLKSMTKDTHINLSLTRTMETDLGCEDKYLWHQILVENVRTGKITMIANEKGMKLINK